MVNLFRNQPYQLFVKDWTLSSKHYPFVVIDALYLKAREDTRVCSKGLLIVQGIREDGHREILGFQVSDSESKNQLE